MVPLSILRSIWNQITRKLRFPKDHCGSTIKMEDGLKFRIFRHMQLNKSTESDKPAVFIVRFKFKRFSHRANIQLSRIPMFMIAGFPGFQDKLWMIDWETGYWQGVYQWNSLEAIEKYKHSFVLGIMNKRAVASSVSYQILPDTNLKNFIRIHKTTS